MKVVAPSSRSPWLIPLLVSSLASCGPDGAEGVWPGASWATSTPEAEGIDPSAVESLVTDLESGEYGLVDAFMLIRHGRVVANHRFRHDYETIAESYDTTNHQYNYDHPEWHPYLKGTDLHTLQSVTKSVTSAALGIAIDEGFLEGVEMPVMPAFRIVCTLRVRSSQRGYDPGRLPHDEERDRVAYRGSVRIRGTQHGPARIK